jgi:hypothetical protein
MKASRNPSLFIEPKGPLPELSQANLIYPQIPYFCTVKPALNRTFIKRKSVLNGNIFRSLDFGAEKDVK